MARARGEGEGRAKPQACRHGICGSSTLAVSRVAVLGLGYNEFVGPSLPPLALAPTPMPRRNYLIILAVAVASLACYRATDHNRYGRFFSEVLNKVDRYYVKPVNDEELFDAAVNGMLETLDENSKFYEPEDARSKLLSVIDQRYGGVGIEVTEEEKGSQLVISGTFVGSPAYDADILAGDRITKIDDWVVKVEPPSGPDAEQGMRLSERATKLIRGPIGTTVRLELARAGHDKPIVVTLKRSEVKVDSVFGYSRMPDDSWDFLLAGRPEIGYVRVRSFGDRTAKELQAALESIHADKLQGLVLDLRGDPGGRLDAAIDVCSLFIPPGQTVVTTRGRDARVLEREISAGPATFTHVPMVVLIDSLSASASEIVSACLQDYHRAVICGTRSFGKGTVQRIITMGRNNSVLKLTTATYWRPSNKNIHRHKDAKETDEWGVMPDKGFVVNMTDKQTEEWLKNRAARELVHRARPPADASHPPQPDTSALDPQLQRALDHLKHKPAEATAPAAKKDAA